MQLQEDWLMRQINSMAQAIAKAIFGREEPEYLPDGEFPETDPLHGRLLDLLDQRQINEAENLLFEQASEDDIAYLLVAADFYDRLGRMSAQELEEADFSHEEAVQGLRDFAGRFGVDFLNAE
ncbi:MAG TPA: hypothetical protein H9694_00340 [Firmicutes bacterium]|nr:hypothetical protein [Bacillota bacterium]